MLQVFRRPALVLLILLAPMMAVQAERQSSKKAKPRKTVARPAAAPLPAGTMTTPRSTDPPIPLQESFNANLKERKKVVIVPAPPPPPGPDPIPPKR